MTKMTLPSVQDLGSACTSSHRFVLFDDIVSDVVVVDDDDGFWSMINYPNKHLYI